jgi:hypothetical protein
MVSSSVVLFCGLAVLLLAPSHASPAAAVSVVDAFVQVALARLI